MRGVLKQLKHYRGWIVTLCIFALLLGCTMRHVGSVEQKTLLQRQENVRSAVLRAAVACYSVEGVYPDNVEYLVEHYGLRYDTETFILQYDAFAENILPDIRVLVRGAE